MERCHLARIVAALSCIPDHPGADKSHVFEMLACLAPGARLSMKSLSKRPYQARRFIKGVEVWSGKLTLENQTWVLHSNDDDDPIWFIKFGMLRPGEYMTLNVPGRSPLVFQIVNVDCPADADGFPSSLQ